MIRLTGFTLELDGAPDHVQRVLSAATAEMSKIENEARRERDALWAGDFRVSAMLIAPASSLRGTLSVRQSVQA